jgi:hypothetical protein
MRRDFLQNRIKVESLFGTHIPPLLGEYYHKLDPIN